MTYYNNYYIGNKPGSEEIYTHAATMDNTMTIESAVLAGPVTFTQTVTITGTLVII
jgi:hypothetical protein|nr:hypothetical protein [uncultured Mediterranean phage uvMED]|tara:strand:+ start:410 stop:577 length:168 start_codon:yes stop_codon:yes gene_type:complete